jgi:hypothetical protein
VAVAESKGPRVVGRGRSLKEIEMTNEIRKDDARANEVAIRAWLEVGFNGGKYSDPVQLAQAALEHFFPEEKWAEEKGDVEGWAKEIWKPGKFETDWQGLPDGEEAERELKARTNNGKPTEVEDKVKAKGQGWGKVAKLARPTEDEAEIEELVDWAAGFTDEAGAVQLAESLGIEGAKGMEHEELWDAIRAEVEKNPRALEELSNMREEETGRDNPRRRANRWRDASPQFERAVRASLRKSLTLGLDKREAVIKALAANAEMVPAGKEEAAAAQATKWAEGEARRALRKHRIDADDQGMDEFEPEDEYYREDLEMDKFDAFEYMDVAIDDDDVGPDADKMTAAFKKDHPKSGLSDKELRVIAEEIIADHKSRDEDLEVFDDTEDLNARGDYGKVAKKGGLTDDQVDEIHDWMADKALENPAVTVPWLVAEAVKEFKLPRKFLSLHSGSKLRELAQGAMDLTVDEDESDDEKAAGDQLYGNKAADRAVRKKAIGPCQCDDPECVHAGNDRAVCDNTATQTLSNVETGEKKKFCRMCAKDAVMSGQWEGDKKLDAQYAEATKAAGITLGKGRREGDIPETDDFLDRPRRRKAPEKKESPNDKKFWALVMKYGGAKVREFFSLVEAGASEEDILREWGFSDEDEDPDAMRAMALIDAASEVDVDELNAEHRAFLSEKVAGGTVRKHDNPAAEKWMYALIHSEDGDNISTAKELAAAAAEHFQGDAALFMKPAKEIMGGEDPYGEGEEEEDEPASRARRWHENRNERWATSAGAEMAAGASMRKKISPRPDVSPADKARAGKEAHSFADTTNRKYKLDTEKQVRAAMSYISHPDNAAKYDAAEVKAIKRRIMAAGKKFGIDWSKETQAEAKKSAAFMLLGKLVVADLVKAIGKRSPVNMRDASDLDKMVNDLDEAIETLDSENREDVAAQLKAQRTLQHLLEAADTLRRFMGVAKVAKRRPADEMSDEGDEEYERPDPGDEEIEAGGFIGEAIEDWAEENPELTADELVQMAVENFGEEATARKVHAKLKGWAKDAIANAKTAHAEDEGEIPEDEEGDFYRDEAGEIRDATPEEEAVEREHYRSISRGGKGKAVAGASMRKVEHEKMARLLGAIERDPKHLMRSRVDYDAVADLDEAIKSGMLEAPAKETREAIARFLADPPRINDSRVAGAARADVRKSQWDPRLFVENPPDPISSADVAKQVAEALAPKLDELAKASATIGGLEARLKHIEDQPLPGGPAIRSSHSQARGPVGSINPAVEKRLNELEKEVSEISRLAATTPQPELAIGYRAQEREKLDALAKFKRENGLSS